MRVQHGNMPDVPVGVIQEMCHDLKLVSLGNVSEV